jgi:hypothetical protein
MNTSVKYGIIGGAIFTFLLISFYIFKVYEITLLARLLGGLDIFALLILILLGIKEKKRKSDNLINYRDAITTGLSINFIIAITQSLTLFLLFQFWVSGFNDFKTYTIQHETVAMKRFGLPQAEIIKNVEMIKTELTAFNSAKINFMKLLLIGLILTLVISFFQRNKIDNTPTLTKG